MAVRKAGKKASGQGRIVAYLRVSTAGQDVASQELAIRKWAEGAGLRVDEWIERQMSATKSEEARGLPDLLAKLQEGDVLVCFALDRMGRSAGQVCNLIDALVKKRVRFIALRDGIDLAANGEKDLQSTIMTATFALLAEVERRIISERTKAGIARAKEKGNMPGRPKGSLSRSKLDEFKDEIAVRLQLGVPHTKICKAYGVHPGTFRHWMESRGIQA